MSEREAWIWLIEAAAWKDTRRRNMKGERIEVARGQYHTSLRTLGETFGWGKNKVSRYLDKLVRYGMIGTVAGQSGVLITICNYAKYQDIALEKVPVPGTVAGQSRDTQEQGKQDSSSNEEGVPPVNIVKAIFDLGVTLLAASGQTDRASRSIVGRWRKEYGDGKVMEALAACQARSITNPVEWVPRFLGAQPNQQQSFTDHMMKKYGKAA